MAELGGTEFIVSNLTTQKLEIKLLKQFGDKIEYVTEKRGDNIILSSPITEEDAFRREANIKCNVDIKVRGVVFALRSQILEVQKTPYRRV